MSPFLPLANPIQNYDWGSHTALAKIQGRGKSRRPEAELWIGSHPSAPSTVSTGASNTGEPIDLPLGEFLRQNLEWLGASQHDFGDRLPFLLKILAAAQPLSLQVHPTRRRAARVFSENPQGPYVDGNHKPEVLCALTPFTALQGFRPFEQSRSHLLELRGLTADLRHELSRFANAPGAPALQSLFQFLLQLRGPRAEPTADLESLLQATRTFAEQQSCPELRRAIDSLLEHYPEDPLVIAPLLMNVVKLSPGEALFTQAGALHSYLEGTGVELMSTSDNVLRAGLTSKAVHAAELIQVTTFEPTLTTILHSEAQPGSAFRRYATPAKEFELGILESNPEDPLSEHVTVTEPTPQSVQLLLCTAGQFVVHDAANRASERIRSGEALLVSANSGPYRLTGAGQLFRAALPRES